MEGLSNREILFEDGFRSPVDEPDADYVTFLKRLGSTNGIFYMHGALHLFERKGEVHKHCWKRSGITLTEHVTKSLGEDNYPLFVAEGESVRKLEHIQRSGYLWYCYQKLQSIKSALVVCGSSLGESDDHIANAIADSECPTVWLGVYGGIDGRDAARMELVTAKLKTRRAKQTKPRSLEVKYYDVSTAPIWNSDQPGLLKKAPRSTIVANLINTGSKLRRG